MLGKRLLTAALLIPLVIALFAYGPIWLVGIIFAICAVISVTEATQILLPSLTKKLIPSSGEQIAIIGQSKLYIGLNILLALVLFTTIALSEGSYSIIYFILILIVTWLVAMIKTKSVEAAVTLYCVNTISITYGSTLWLVGWQLFNLEDGYAKVLLLLTVVFCSDSGAYFTGIKFGKHKLAPRLSPKKTIEGVVGGVILGVLGAVILNYLFGGRIASYQMIIIMAVITSLIAVLGDLFESSLKRFAKVKDSGGIFPGHGGMLDRIDALTFAAPIVWLLLFIDKIQ